MHPVVVHTPEETCAAFAAAAQAGAAELVLRTAPEAAYFAGVMYLKAMVEQAARSFPCQRYTLWVDCGGEPAVVMGALRCGFTHLITSCEKESFSKLEDIARQHGASLLPSAT